MGDETPVEQDNPRSESDMGRRTTARDRSRLRRGAEMHSRQGSGFFSQAPWREGIASSEVGPGPNEVPTQPRSMAVPASGKTVRLGIDVPLILAIIALLIFGMLMVHSASWKYSLAEYGDPTAIFWRQLAWTGIGLGIGVFLGFLNYRRMLWISIPLMLATLGLLLVVLLVHDERHGAVRTLLGGSIQPSELAKLMIIIYLSAWLYNRKDQLHSLTLGLIPLGIILGLVGGLIALQPDYSAVLTIFLLGGIMFFVGGGDFKQIVVLIVLGAMVGMLVMGVTATGKDRIANFVTGLKDPLQSSDHVQRSLESFAKGGVFGVGIGKADTKLTVLPFPHTDSIFAVVGEETGIIGSVILVTLYLIVMWRGLVIASRTDDRLGKLLAAGLSLWVALEAFVNMAVMVGLLPFAGNALPFVSAGGSNRIVSLAAMGLVLSVSRLTEKSQEEKERLYSAGVDLRRRDWRRGIPRPRHSTSNG